MSSPEPLLVLLKLLREVGDVQSLKVKGNYKSIGPFHFDPEKDDQHYFDIIQSYGSGWDFLRRLNL